MTRIYQNTKITANAELTLDENASHHLARVMRCKVNDELIIFNGEGGEYKALITNITKKTVTVNVVKHIDCNRESPINLYLAQGIARGEKMDFIMQKAVELGASKIFPLMTERVNVQLKGDREAKRMQHWQGVVQSACEQSGRTSIPQLCPPQSLNDYLQGVKPDHAFVLSPHVEGSLGSVKVKAGESVALLIGPEGGLSEAEIEFAITQGYQVLNLGTRVLRTETATLVALTLLQARFGDI